MIRKNMTPPRTPSPPSLSSGSEGDDDDDDVKGDDDGVGDAVMAGEREEGEETRERGGGGVMGLKRFLTVVVYCNEYPMDLLVAACLIENARLGGVVTLGFRRPLRRRHVEQVTRIVGDTYRSGGRDLKVVDEIGEGETLPLSAVVLDLGGYIKAAGLRPVLQEGLRDIEEAAGGAGGFEWDYARMRGARDAVADMLRDPVSYELDMGMALDSLAPSPVASPTERDILGAWAGAMECPPVGEGGPASDEEFLERYRAFYKRQALDLCLGRTEQMRVLREHFGEGAPGGELAELDMLRTGLTVHRHNVALVQKTVVHGGSIELAPDGRHLPRELGRGLVVDFGAVPPPECAHAVMGDYWRKSLREEAEVGGRGAPGTCFTLYHYTHHVGAGETAATRHNWSMQLWPTAEELISASEVDTRWGKRGLKRFMREVVQGECVTVTWAPAGLGCECYGGISYEALQSVLQEQ